MAIFGSDKHNTSEIGKIWERFVPVEKQVSDHEKILGGHTSQIQELNEKVKQPSESQAEAQKSSRSATAHNANVKKMKQEVIESLALVKGDAKEISTVKDNALTNTEELSRLVVEIQSNFDSVKSASETAESHNSRLQVAVQKLDQLLVDNESLEDDVEQAKISLSEIESVRTKVNNLLKVSAEISSEIKEIKDEIFGYSVDNEEGEEPEIVEGLKNKLESSYRDIKNKIDGMDSYVAFIQDEAQSQFDKFVQSNNSKAEETHKKIRKLLPESLTVGLSFAYDEKITAEKESLVKFEETFQKAIYWMLGISSVPFLIDAYLLVFLSADLLLVIKDTPKLIVSILPVYFPVLWMAYSSSKKINLSKRLIEEYTHKGVLSKTFEGLSNQVGEIEDDKISSELRAKLLFNLLHVNSENPGKLISDYNTSDHPIVDVLEKSMKLNDSIEIASKIPGLGALAVKLDKRKKEQLKEEENKVARVLADDEDDSIDQLA